METSLKIEGSICIIEGVEIFVICIEGAEISVKNVLKVVKGQQEIHAKIVELNFKDCHAKIRKVGIR